MTYGTQLARERVLLLGWSLGLLVYFFVIGISYAAVKDHEKGLPLPNVVDLSRGY